MINNNSNSIYVNGRQLWTVKVNSLISVHLKKGPTFQRTNLTGKRLIFIRDGMFDLKSKLSYILYKFEKKKHSQKINSSMDLHDDKNKINLSDRDIEKIYLLKWELKLMLRNHKYLWNHNDFKHCVLEFVIMFI